MKNFLRLLLACAMAFAVWWTGWLRRENVEVLRNEASTETRLLLALDDTHTGLMDVQNGRGVIAYANAAACDIFGYKNMTGMEVAAILPEPFRATHWERMKLAMHDGSPRHVAVMRCFALLANGEQVAVVVRVNISRNGVQAMVNRADELSYSDTTVPP